MDMSSSSIKSFCTENFVADLNEAFDLIRSYEIESNAKFVAVKGPSRHSFGSRSRSLKSVGDGTLKFHGTQSLISIAFLGFVFK